MRSRTMSLCFRASKLTRLHVHLESRLAVEAANNKIVRESRIIQAFFIQ